MYQIFFKGIRCFHDFHSCPIKPITLLVGENSSGKTTFLALTRIAWDAVNGDFDEDLFNEEPFLLGSYDQMASFRGGRAGRAKTFMVGQQFDINLDSDQIEIFTNNVKIAARFIQQGSEPKLHEWIFECGKYNFTAKRSTKQDYIDVIVNTPNGSYKPEPNQVSERIFSNRLDLLRELRFLNRRNINRTEDRSKSKESETLDDELRILDRIAYRILRSFRQRPYAFAPIRTRPQRTYDPLKVVYDPEGSHVPMLLNRILTDESKEGEGLRKALSFFGDTSGLFSNIEVKRKGNKDSDPFQIAVKTTGPSFNLIDVGYGISQSLPLIVDIVLNPSNSTFLLQQPEVHLHPQAQAGLGSFLAYTAKEQNKTFVIETHSDYLIDRIRMDVRDKKYITPDDVAILYFEKEQGNVKIHELKLDEYGNIIDAPPTYRQFFLEEERRMLGI